jgi:Tol biopolymer transport system component
VIGSEFSHYKNVEKIGEGGMGIVYRAEDTRLHRSVALKFLPPHLTSDADAVARFGREAQAAAALKHPNIVIIYDIGEFEGQTYISMEHVEGEDLATVLERGPIPVEQAVDIAAQIGEGLGEAHQAGIAHRDIKPENILVGGDGQIKILDFGLAKLRGVSRLTKESSTVGTATYMSPELTTGQEADQRTDIWSLGVVLYEMVTGRSPFASDYEQAVSYAIVNQNHDPLGDTVPELPGGLEGVVDRALAKKPEDRYQSVDQMTAKLRALQHPAGAGTQPATGVPLGRPGRRKRRIPAVVGVVAAVLVVAAAVLVWRWMRPDGGTEAVPPAATGAPADARQVELKQVTFSDGLEEFPAFSPDGNQLAYCWEISGFKQVFVKDLSTGGERQVTDSRADNIQPSWSPDAKSIVYVRSNRTDGKLEPGDVFGMYQGGDVWRHDLETGGDQKLLDGAFNPAISPDGQLIAVDASCAGTRRVWVSDNYGRNPQQVTFDSSEAVSQIDPGWSPDGSKIVFLNKDWTTFDIKVVDVHSREMNWVTNDLHQDLNPVWSPTGSGVYFSSTRGGGMNVWRVPLKPDGRPLAPPQQVTTGAGQDVQLAMSADGKKLAFSIVGINADLWRLPVSPETGMPAGDPEKVVTTTREDSRGAWSPDGQRIAFNSDRTGDMNIWVYSFVDESAKRVTTGPGGDYQANWSPDGTKLTFFSSRAGNADIWLVDLVTGELSQLTRNLSLDINPFFSPEGGRIAYQSDRDGRLEVWVVQTDGTNRRRLTNIGASGHFIRWTADGKYAVFRSPQGPSGQLYRIAAAGGSPEPLVAAKGGAHISFSPTFDAIMDVSGHKTMWLTPLPEGDARVVFEFDDPDVRIDYPVWSPDGRWVLFDRVKPGGGDIWLIENFE